MHAACLLLHSFVKTLCQVCKPAMQQGVAKTSPIGCQADMQDRSHIHLSTSAHGCRNTAILQGMCCLVIVIMIVIMVTNAYTFQHVC